MPQPQNLQLQLPDEILNSLKQVDDAEEVKVWLQRVEASKKIKKGWEMNFRVAECYHYWRGRQRDEEMEGSDRKAMHNMIHPDVAEELPALYYYAPYGKVVASPMRAATSGETVSQKARLLENIGKALALDPKTGLRENTFLALKESRWAFGCVEVGYSPDFIENPAAMRPELREKNATQVSSGTEGVAVVPQSDAEDIDQEIRRYRTSLKGETFYVKHIPASQVLVSPSDKPIMENNDWVGYWDDYSLEDVKRSLAYQNTDDLKAAADQGTLETDGSVSKVRLYKLWDLRTMTKIVLAEGHDKFLMRMPVPRCNLKFLRPDLDTRSFYPVPPVFLKLASQDEYNDSAEYLRKMRITTVPRYTYDEDAVNADEASKFQSRDMHIMIPRRSGSRGVIEPVQQPSTAATAVQTLGMSEQQFTKASNTVGSPFNPATQTATRVAAVSEKILTLENFNRAIVGVWLASIIEELILLAIDHMNLARVIALNVDLDSETAMSEAAEVAQTFQMVTAEQLRDANLGIWWHVEVDADSLSPVAEEEKGQKLMSTLQLLSNPSMAALMSRAPKLLKRILQYSGVRSGEDVDALMEGLNVIVQMNTMAAAQSGATMPGPTPPGATPPGSAMGPPPPAPMPNLPPRQLAGTSVVRPPMVVPGGH